MFIQQLVVHFETWLLFQDNLGHQKISWGHERPTYLETEGK